MNGVGVFRRQNVGHCWHFIKNKVILLLISIHRTSIDIKLLVQNHSKLKCHQMTKHAKTQDLCFLMDFFLVHFTKSSNQRHIKKHKKEHII